MPTVYYLVSCTYEHRFRLKINLPKFLYLIYLGIARPHDVRTCSWGFSTRGKETILGLRFLRFLSLLRTTVKAIASGECFTEVGRATGRIKTVHRRWPCVAREQKCQERLRERRMKGRVAQNGARWNACTHHSLPLRCFTNLRMEMVEGVRKGNAPGVHRSSCHRVIVRLLLPLSLLP